MRTTTHYDWPVFIIFFDFLLDVFFYASEFEWRQHLAIGEIFQAIPVTADAYKSLHMGIPGCKIIIPDGPIHCKCIAGGRFKFKPAPALRCPCPNKRFAAHLVTSYPVKRFFLDVWMLFILYKKMLGGFIESIATANNRVFFSDMQRHGQTMFKIPWIFGGCRIIFDMLHIPAAFQNQGFQTMIT